MRFSSVLCWLKGLRTSTRRGRPEPGPSRRPKRTCRPSLELLEDRCVPALFVVNTLADVGAGSLGEAITFANDEVRHPGADVITFAPGVTGILRLNRVLPDLTSDIDIQGPGANVLTVRRDSGSGDYSILVVEKGTATVSGLTLANGNTPLVGGGIDNEGTLRLSNCTLSDNTAHYGGGGIYNVGRLTVNNCTLADNHASADNGGGIYNSGGMLTVNNSTLSTNTATTNGGGIYNSSTGTLELSNSTLSGNEARGYGAGLFNDAGSATLTNATLTANRANSDGHAFGLGGGILNAGTLTLHNTLVAGNFTGTGTARDDVWGSVETPSSYNLVGDGTNLGGISHNDANGNQVGTVATPIDPKLGPLQNNGGPTFTHALLSDSPALNRGLFPGAQATDQRGFGPRTSGGAGDVGAFEFIPPPPPSPPPPGPPPVVQARALVAALVSKKVGQTRRLFVRVSFADTGVLRTQIRSPFQNPAFRRILVTVFDSNGDGVADTVLVTALKAGPGKKRVKRVLFV
jgi:hypothetical protein